MSRGSNATSNDVPIAKFEDDHSPKGNGLFVKIIEIVRKTNEYKSPKDLKLNDFDVKGKGFERTEMCPLYRKHESRNFMVARFDSRCPMHVTTQILSKGVNVCYEEKPGIREQYTFFAHSASQLRNRVCVLYNNNPNIGKAEDIIGEFGDFEKIKTAAKRAARIGLLLSTAGETCKLQQEDITRIDDVERNDYTFTDGCGHISPALARKITEHLGISKKYHRMKNHICHTFAPGAVNANAVNATHLL